MSSQYIASLKPITNEAQRWRSNTFCPREPSIDNTRFFTYVGLVVATVIIFNRNMVVASVIGALVSVYIGGTEYYLANNSLNGDLQPSIQNLS